MAASEGCGRSTACLRQRVGGEAERGAAGLQQRGRRRGWRRWAWLRSRALVVAEGVGAVARLVRLQRATVATAMKEAAVVRWWRAGGARGAAGVGAGRSRDGGGVVAAAGGRGSTLEGEGTAAGGARVDVEASLRRGGAEKVLVEAR